MYILLIFLLIATDQVIKFAVRANFEKFESLPVIEGFFHLTYVQNKGAAFGMLQNRTWIFIVITVAVVGYIIYYITKNKNADKRLKLILSVIAAGAVGNLIDRVMLGYVVDMFDFRGIWQFIFNFADICVVLGTLSLLILVITDQDILESL